MPKPTHEAVEAMRHVAQNGSLTVNQQWELRQAVESGALDGTPDVKAAVARRAEGHERTSDRDVIGQHIHKIAPKYDD